MQPLLADIPGLQFNGHETGDGELIRRHACQLGFEGVVSKTADAPYAPGNRGLWRKAKCLNRQEFVVVGWTDPEGSRPHLGALLLGYYTDDGKLIYAGRVGTGMPEKVLNDLRRRLDPLARTTSPLSVPPPRTTRFGSPLVLSRVHWVEPKLVAEITYLTWTADNLLRHTVYVGLREDKPADQVRRERSSGGPDARISCRRGRPSMMLYTSRITDLLRKKPGRYLDHGAGSYRMKEAGGEDVTVIEDRRTYLVEPTAQQIDDLIDAKRLVIEGSKYVLPPKRPRRPRA